MLLSQVKDLWSRLDKKALAISMAILAGLIVLNILAITFMGGNIK